MQTSKRKILLIEDDLSLEPMLSSILHDIDPSIEMDSVTSAEAAISKLEEAQRSSKKNPYELIIADIFLDGKITGVDFWDLCRNIYPKMPTLVMSGLPLNKFFDFIGPNNVCPPFLEKPLHLLECRQTLQRMLNYGQ